jgi:putative ABC transport system permease protein
MWKNYLVIGWRNIIRSKVFSLINIGGLALGLTCCILILLYVKDETTFDRFQQNGNELYRIKVTMTSSEDEKVIASTNSIHGPSFKEGIPEIRDVIRTQNQPFVVKKGEDFLSANVLFADPIFFEVFSLPLLHGDPKTVLSDIGSIVLTEEIAQSYFGSTDVIGKVVELKVNDQFVPFTVSGVVKSIPQNSTIQFDSMISFEWQVAKGWTNDEWLGFYMNTFVFLNPGADPAQVGSKMNQIFEINAAKELANSPGFKEKVSFSLQPFMDIHLDNGMDNDRNGITRTSNPVYSYILGGIGLFILIIACINFVNLAVARSLNRAKEIGIRKVIGGQRKQLIVQFLTESFLLTFFAFLLAFMLAQLTLPTFNVLANKQLSLSYLLDTNLILVFAGLFALTGLVAGFYPALVISGFSPTKSLYKRDKLVQRNFLTKGLVVFQFTLSICLVVGTILIFSQFNFLTTLNLGYDDERLMKLNGMRGNRAGMEAIKQELASMSEIAAVAGYNGNYNGTIAKVNDETIEFGYIGVDDNFLNTLEIQLVEGRNFSSEFATDPEESILVNEAFLKEVGWTEGVGKEVDFEWKNKKMKVIGVVKDYHFASLKEKIAPLVLTQDPKYGLQTLFIKLHKGSTADAVKKIETVFRKHVPFMPFDYSFEEENNLKRYEREARWRQMITVGAMLSIFVSCIGLFGLAAFNAESRVKEVGVRKVMGASVGSIVTLLSTDFVKLILLAVLIAVPISYYGGTVWLKEFAYQIRIEWWFFAVAGVFGIGIAMLTVGFEAFKAAIRNPVETLKNE